MWIWFQSNHIYLLRHQNVIPFSSLQFHLITLRHYIESRNLGQVGAPSTDCNQHKETCKMLKVSAKENWQNILSKIYSYCLLQIWKSCVNKSVRLFVSKQQSVRRYIFSSISQVQIWSLIKKIGVWWWEALSGEKSSIKGKVFSSFEFISSRGNLIPAYFGVES